MVISSLTSSSILTQPPPLQLTEDGDLPQLIAKISNFNPPAPISAWLEVVFGGWCCGEVCQLTARSAAIVSSCGAGGRGWWPPTLLWLGLPAHLPTMLPTPIYYDML